MSRLIVIFGLVAGCSYTPDDFHEVSQDASCDLAVRCGAWATQDECLESVEVEDTRGCTFDAAAARECVEALETARCPADGSLPDQPDVCADVWSECP